MSSRRWLAREVVQTSEMDCGPACLKSLVDGFGGYSSYGRLREACQTDVDGTSIDTIEDVGTRLGLACEQVLVAPEQVLAAEAGHLPCLAVVRHPSGEPHFVVLWRRHGPLVQVMDPACGRRWIGARRLEGELWVHELDLPAGEWRAWAGSAAFLVPLEHLLRALGVPDAARLVEAAADAPGWRALATLDAVARMVAELVRAGDVARRRAPSVVTGLLAEEERHADPGAVVPARWWMARAHEAGSESLLVRGAVLVRARAYDPRTAAGEGELSRELAAAVAEPPPRPWRTILGVLRGGSRAALVSPIVIGAGVGLAALGLALEALLLRGLLDADASLRLPEQRIAALAAVLVLLATLLALELPLGALIQSVARRIETALRLEFLRKLARLELRYFRSRPASDMAERAHAIHRLREVVALGASVARGLAEGLAVTAGLVWLAPESWPLVLLLAAACLVPPLLMQGPLIERDLRVRTHAGALSRFTLDALLGAVPVATHGAAGALAREHEGLLVEWARAARSAVSTAAGFAALHSAAVVGLAIALVLGELARGREPAGALLLVLWTMTLLWLCEPLGAAARAAPTLRNVALRLLEPLGAAEDESAASEAHAAHVASTGAALRGVALELEDVTAHASGHAVLAGVTLAIAPGEQIAIVGESGAGKSSLCGLFLGWLRASSGSVRADGRELDAGALAALRRGTAWVDAEVQLWNRSLAGNVRYGARAGGPGLGELCESAELHALLPRLADGLQTPLGESGRLVSGGEGQRVRLARALARDEARLVVLDEPFRGLDREQRRLLLTRARAHWPGATLLYVTHKVAEALELDRVLVMHAGRVVEDGPPRELERDEGSTFRALLGHERACAELWEDASWRRLRLADGRLEEHRSCARAV